MVSQKILTLKKIFYFFGIDRAVAYTLLGRVWSVLAGPVSLFFVASFLSPEEQGFYYTFGSLLGLQIFFELGLSYVILQSASHEKAWLEWNAERVLVGKEEAKIRLSSLLRLALIWYGISAILMIIIVLPLGYWFFVVNQPEIVKVNWQWPWVITVMATAFGLLVSPIFAVLEGCGQIPDMALMRSSHAFFGHTSLWLGLWLRFGLFAVPIFNLTATIWYLTWVIIRYKKFLLDLIVQYKHGKQAIEHNFNWWRDIWPFQWKIAVSWLSGYFITQLFNPVLFAFQGPVIAGQMGMSLALTTAIQTFSLSWLNTKAAPFGSLIAKKDFNQLDRLFRRTFLQAFAVVVSASTCFLGVTYYLIANQYQFSERLLPFFPLSMLTLNTVINLVIVAEAIYLRAHKEEPFLWPSVLNGILTGGSAIFFGVFSDVVGVTASYLTVTTLSLIIGTSIFFRKRTAWH